MKHKSVPIVSPNRSAAPVTMLENTFDVARGVVLEGTVALPAAGDAALTGLCVECANQAWIAITVSRDGIVKIGPIRPDTSDFQPDKQANREVVFRTPVPFRLLVEHSLLEFYLDDILMECYSLPAVAAGRIGLLGGTTVLRSWYSA
jgi:hypothetical protein